MTFKRYIKINGKRYGPYSYKSYRDSDGRVKNKYFGKKEETDKSKNLIENSKQQIKPITLSEHPQIKSTSFRPIIMPLTVIISILALLAFLGPYFTGFSISAFEKPEGINLEKTSFSPNESLGGYVSLYLREGELLPAQTRVTFAFEKEGQIKYSNVLSLSDFFEISDIVLEKTNGEFYSTKTSLSGNGEGYGYEGIKKSYPEISFELKSVSAAQTAANATEVIPPEQPQENITENSPAQEQAPSEQLPAESPAQPVEQLPVETPAQPPQAETPQEQPPSEQPTEQAPAQSPAIENSPAQEQAPSEQSPSLTGAVIGIITGKAVSGDEETTISRTCSKNNPFTLMMGDADFELVSGSVKIGDKTLDDSVLNIKSENGEITVSTDYTVEEQGFGEDYLTNETERIDLNLEKLNISLDEEGDYTAKVSFSYENSEIAKFEQSITVNSTLEAIETTLIEDDPTFDAIIDSAEYDNETGILKIIFHHDANKRLPVSIAFNETPIDYSFSRLIVDKGENVTLIVNGWDESKYFEVKVGEHSEKVGFGNVPEYSINGGIRDHKGEKVNATINFIKKKSIKQTIGEGTEVAEVKKGTYDIKISLNETPVKEILVKDYDLNSNISGLINVDDVPESGNYVETYAIDPTSLNFTSATVTVIAQGSALYKCKDWNFSAQECFGEWVKLMDIIPGQEYTFTLTAEDPGYGETTSQSCSAEDNTATKSSFSGACDGIYPGACNATGDLLSCNDGNLETHTSNGDTKYGGIKITQYNASITDCSVITNVEICYEWWASASTIAECDISVDNDNGTSFSAVTNICPGTTANPEVNCTNVTSLDDWNCSNFFGSSGTRAQIKSEFRRNGSTGTRTMSWDALYFRINYTQTSVDTTPPATVTNLNESSISFTWIYWNWTNPGDADFNHTEIWIDSNYIVNISKPSNSYNATGFAANTTHTISTRTADNSRNINTTFVNDSATTLAAAGDATPPAISNITTTRISDSSLEIAWITDENADSKIDYGLNASFGNNITNSTLSTNHSITLINLSAENYYYNITSCDAYNNCATQGPYNFSMLFNLSLRIKNSDNESVSSDIEIYNESNTLEKSHSGSQFQDSVKSGKKKIKIRPSSGPVSEINFNEVNINNNTTAEIGYDNTPEFGNFVEVYAIDPTQLNFTNATVTATAKGTELYKCKDWNFTTRTCANNNWTALQSIIPGQNYTLTLTPEDPGYAEGTTANLSIWDDTDSLTKGIGEQIKFYANYTNRSAGAAINGTSVWCEIKFNITGSWTSPVNMSFNSSSLLYNYNRSLDSLGTYAWNALCNGSALGYDILNATDNVTITFNPNITGCTSITSAGTYYLQNNVNSSGTCFNIQASNVALDCAGYSVTGNNSSTTYGIYSNQFNTTIRNCNISNFATGIYFNTAKNGTIDNTTARTTQAASGNNGYGIYLYNGANYNRIMNSNANASAGYGIYLSISSYNTISNTTATTTASNSYAIRLSSNSNYNTIANTTATAYNSAIFFQSSSNYNTISNSTVTATNYAIYLQSNHNTISNSTVTATNNAIYLDSGSNNTLIANIIMTSGTNSNGIRFLYNSQNNILLNNFIRSTTTYIYTASNSTDNNITNTTFNQTNSSVRFPATITIPGNKTISQSNLNLTFNKVYLNTGELTFLNTGAEITLRNLAFTEPKAIVDYDDDGSFENCTSCAELNYSGGTFVYNVTGFTTYSSAEKDTTPPASVTNLANQSSGQTWIYWAWTNPSDADFNSGIVFIDSVNLANTTNNFYNATGLSCGTNYTIKIWTKDNAGNVNYTNVSSTASTVTCPNSPPTHDTPILRSTFGTNYTTENLTCYNQSTSDAEGDPVKNIYGWYKNNNAIIVLNIPFEGGSNSTYTKDYSGFSNNGIVINNTWNNTAGYDGKGAYQFNGTSSTYILVPKTDSMNVTNKFTLEAWVYALKLNGVKKIYSEGDGYIDFGVDAGEVYIKIYNGTDIFSYGPSLSTNKWYFVAATFNGSALSIYVNGTLKNSVNATGIIKRYNSKQNASIGRSLISSANPFNGTIDDFRLYNESLSAATILQHYVNNTNVVTSNELSANDIWQCSVTPNDGYNDGITKSSNTLMTIPLDNILPSITVYSPQNTTYSGTNSVLVNFTATDNINVSSKWYYNETANRTYTTPETITLADGSHTFIFYANDTSNNLNSTSVIFFVDSCVPNMTNSSWSSWINLTCSGSQMNQSRFKTEYDSNACGFVNVTYYEYQLVGPTYQNITWTNWYNITACLPGDYYTQERNATQYDAYSCAANQTFFEYQNQTCDFCTPSLVNTSWTSWYDISSCYANNTKQQARNKTQYDSNSCNEIANQTLFEYQTASCDYDGAPRVSIISPLNQTYSNRTVLVNIIVADSAPDKIWYEWNGANYSYISPVYVTFNGGSNVLRAWANDSLSNLNSTSVIFSTNLPPVVTVSSITPATAYTNNDLTCSFTVTDSDIGDSLSANYTWHKNNAINLTGSISVTKGTESSIILGNGNTTKNEIWNCSIIPYDTKSYGTEKSAARTISNSLPTAPFVNVIPITPSDNEDLIATIATASTDLDDDSITYSYQWYKNNILQVGQTSNSLSKLLTSIGDVWKCVVTPNDGTANGATGYDEVEIFASDLDINAPVITIVNPTNGAALAAGTTSTYINITTNENAECRYNTANSTFAFNDGIIFTTTGNSAHSFLFSGLSDGQSYTFYYKCSDNYSNVNNVSTAHSFSVLTAPYCGDSSCNNGETCSTCPTDCGSCGGGGGGGRKIVVQNKTNISQPIIPITPSQQLAGCTEKWRCSEFTECTIEGIQVRACSDENKCGTSISKPVEIQSCVKPTCSDGIQNQEELGIDCGGSCARRCGIAEIIGSVVEIPAPEKTQKSGYGIGLMALMFLLIGMLAAVNRIESKVKVQASEKKAKKEIKKFKFELLLAHIIHIMIVLAIILLVYYFIKA